MPAHGLISKFSKSPHHHRGSVSIIIIFISLIALGATAIIGNQVTSKNSTTDNRGKAASTICPSYAGSSSCFGKPTGSTCAANSICVYGGGICTCNAVYANIPTTKPAYCDPTKCKNGCIEPTTDGGRCKVPYCKAMCRDGCAELSLEGGTCKAFCNKTCSGSETCVAGADGGFCQPRALPTPTSIPPTATPTTPYCNQAMVNFCGEMIPKKVCVPTAIGGTCVAVATPTPTNEPTLLPSKTPVPTNTLPSDTPTTPYCNQAMVNFCGEMIPKKVCSPTTLGGTCIAAPTLIPTKTPAPTKEPTPLPTKTPVPTKTPTPLPTKQPTPKPTEVIKIAVLPSKTPIPTKTPTPLPTKTPIPTKSPTPKPTLKPIINTSQAPIADTSDKIAPKTGTSNSGFGSLVNTPTKTPLLPSNQVAQKQTLPTPIKNPTLSTTNNPASNPDQPKNQTNAKPPSELTSTPTPKQLLQSFADAINNFISQSSTTQSPKGTEPKIPYTTKANVTPAQTIGSALTKLFGNSPTPATKAVYHPIATPEAATNLITSLQEQRAAIFRECGRLSSESAEQVCIANSRQQLAAIEAKIQATLPSTGCTGDTCANIRQDIKQQVNNTFAQASLTLQAQATQAEQRYIEESSRCADIRSETEQERCYQRAVSARNSAVNTAIQNNTYCTGAKQTACREIVASSQLVTQNQVSLQEDIYAAYERIDELQDQCAAIQNEQQQDICFINASKQIAAQQSNINNLISNNPLCQKDGQLFCQSIVKTAQQEILATIPLPNNNPTVPTQPLTDAQIQNQILQLEIAAAEAQANGNMNTYNTIKADQQAFIAANCTNNIVACQNLQREFAAALAGHQQFASQFSELEQQRLDLMSSPCVRNPDNPTTYDACITQHSQALTAINADKARLRASEFCQENPTICADVAMQITGSTNTQIQNSNSTQREVTRFVEEYINISNQLLQCELANAQGLDPCSDREIQNLEQRLQNSRSSVASCATTDLVCQSKHAAATQITFGGNGAAGTDQITSQIVSTVREAKIDAVVSSMANSFAYSADQGATLIKCFDLRRCFIVDRNHPTGLEIPKNSINSYLENRQIPTLSVEEQNNLLVTNGSELAGKAVVRDFSQNRIRTTADGRTEYFICLDICSWLDPSNTQQSTDALTQFFLNDPNFEGMSEADARYQAETALNSAGFGIASDPITTLLQFDASLSDSQRNIIQQVNLGMVEPGSIELRERLQGYEMSNLALQTFYDSSKSLEERVAAGVLAISLNGRGAQGTTEYVGELNNLNTILQTDTARGLTIAIETAVNSTLGQIPLIGNIATTLNPFTDFRLGALRTAIELDNGANTDRDGEAVAALLLAIAGQGGSQTAMTFAYDTWIGEAASANINTGLAGVNNFLGNTELADYQLRYAGGRQDELVNRVERFINPNSTPEEQMAQLQFAIPILIGQGVADAANFYFQTTSNVALLGSLRAEFLKTFIEETALEPLVGNAIGSAGQSLAQQQALNLGLTEQQARQVVGTAVQNIGSTFGETVAGDAQQNLRNYSTETKNAISSFFNNLFQNSRTNTTSVPYTPSITNASLGYNAADLVNLYSQTGTLGNYTAPSTLSVALNTQLNSVNTMSPEAAAFNAMIAAQAAARNQTQTTWSYPGTSNFSQTVTTNSVSVGSQTNLATLTQAQLNALSVFDSTNVVNTNRPQNSAPIITNAQAEALLADYYGMQAAPRTTQTNQNIYNPLSSIISNNSIPLINQLASTNTNSSAIVPFVALNSLDPNEADTPLFGNANNLTYEALLTGRAKAPTSESELAAVALSGLIAFDVTATTNLNPPTTNQGSLAVKPNPNQQTVPVKPAPEAPIAQAPVNQNTEAKPENGAAPVQPVAPVNPVVPINPDQPKQPVNPVQPQQPAAPPAQPNDSTDPIDPADPQPGLNNDNTSTSPNDNPNPLVEAVNEGLETAGKAISSWPNQLDVIAEPLEAAIAGFKDFFNLDTDEQHADSRAVDSPVAKQDGVKQIDSQQDSKPDSELAQDTSVQPALPVNPVVPNIENKSDTNNPTTNVVNPVDIGDKPIIQDNPSDALTSAVNADPFNCSPCSVPANTILNALQEIEKASFNPQSTSQLLGSIQPSIQALSDNKLAYSVARLQEAYVRYISDPSVVNRDNLLSIYKNLDDQLSQIKNEYLGYNTEKTSSWVLQISQAQTRLHDHIYEIISPKFLNIFSLPRLSLNFRENTTETIEILPLKNNIEFVVGRFGGDIVPHLPIIDDEKFISKKHAQFTRSNGVIKVKDLDSTNGTYVNGIRINSEKELSEGDVIRLGQYGYAHFLVINVDGNLQISGPLLNGNLRLLRNQYLPALIPVKSPYLSVFSVKNINAILAGIKTEPDLNERMSLINEMLSNNPSIQTLEQISNILSSFPQEIRDTLISRLTDDGSGPLLSTIGTMIIRISNLDAEARQDQASQLLSSITNSFPGIAAIKSLTIIIQNTQAVIAQQRTRGEIEQLLEKVSNSLQTVEAKTNIVNSQSLNEAIELLAQIEAKMTEITDIKRDDLEAQIYKYKLVISNTLNQLADKYIYEKYPLMLPASIPNRVEENPVSEVEDNSELSTSEDTSKSETALAVPETSPTAIAEIETPIGEQGEFTDTEFVTPYDSATDLGKAADAVQIAQEITPQKKLKADPNKSNKKYQLPTQLSTRLNVGNLNGIIAQFLLANNYRLFRLHVLLSRLPQFRSEENIELEISPEQLANIYQLIAIDSKDPLPDSSDTAELNKWIKEHIEEINQQIRNTMRDKFSDIKQNNRSNEQQITAILEQARSFINSSNFNEFSTELNRLQERIKLFEFLTRGISNIMSEMNDLRLSNEYYPRMSTSQFIEFFDGYYRRRYEIRDLLERISQVNNRLKYGGDSLEFDSYMQAFRNLHDNYAYDPLLRSVLLAATGVREASDFNSGFNNWNMSSNIERIEQLIRQIETKTDEINNMGVYKVNTEAVFSFIRTFNSLLSSSEYSVVNEFLSDSREESLSDLFLALDLSLTDAIANQFSDPDAVSGVIDNVSLALQQARVYANSQLTAYQAVREGIYNLNLDDDLKLSIGTIDLNLPQFSSAKHFVSEVYSQTSQTFDRDAAYQTLRNIEQKYGGISKSRKKNSEQDLKRMQELISLIEAQLKMYDDIPVITAPTIGTNLDTASNNKLLAEFFGEGSRETFGANGSIYFNRAQGNATKIFHSTTVSNLEQLLLMLENHPWKGLEILPDIQAVIVDSENNIIGFKMQLLEGQTLAEAGALSTSQKQKLTNNLRQFHSIFQRAHGDLTYNGMFSNAENVFISNDGKVWLIDPSGEFITDLQNPKVISEEEASLKQAVADYGTKLVPDDKIKLYNELLLFKSKADQAQGVYVEIHAGKDGQLYITPEPNTLHVGWATVGGQHSFWDAIREVSFKTFNLIEYVISTNILNTDTILAKGTLTLDPQSNTYKLNIENIVNPNSTKKLGYRSPNDILIKILEVKDDYKITAVTSSYEESSANGTSLETSDVPRIVVKRSDHQTFSGDGNTLRNYSNELYQGIVYELSLESSIMPGTTNGVKVFSPQITYTASFADAEVVTHDKAVAVINNGLGLTTTNTTPLTIKINGHEIVLNGRYSLDIADNSAQVNINFNDKPELLTHEEVHAVTSAISSAILANLVTKISPELQSQLSNLEIKLVISFEGSNLKFININLADLMDEKGNFSPSALSNMLFNQQFNPLNPGNKSAEKLKYTVDDGTALNIKQDGSQNPSVDDASKPPDTAKEHPLELEEPQMLSFQSCPIQPFLM